MIYAHKHQQVFSLLTPWVIYFTRINANLFTACNPSSTTWLISHAFLTNLPVPRSLPWWSSQSPINITWLLRRDCCPLRSSLFFLVSECPMGCKPVSSVSIGDCLGPTIWYYQCLQRLLSIPPVILVHASSSPLRDTERRYIPTESNYISSICSNSSQGWRNLSSQSILALVSNNCTYPWCTSWDRFLWFISQETGLSQFSCVTVCIAIMFTFSRMVDRNWRAGF